MSDQLAAALEAVDGLCDADALELHRETSRRAARIRMADPAHRAQVERGRQAGAAKRQHGAGVPDRLASELLERAAAAAEGAR